MTVGLGESGGGAAGTIGTPGTWDLGADRAAKRAEGFFGVGFRKGRVRLQRVARAGAALGMRLTHDCEARCLPSLEAHKGRSRRYAEKRVPGSWNVLAGRSFLRGTLSRYIDQACEYPRIRGIGLGNPQQVVVVGDL